jgi:hypothetical protein
MEDGKGRRECWNNGILEFNVGEFKVGIFEPCNAKLISVICEICVKIKLILYAVRFTLNNYTEH